MKNAITVIAVILLVATVYFIRRRQYEEGLVCALVGIIVTCMNVVNNVPAILQGEW